MPLIQKPIISPGQGLLLLIELYRNGVCQERCRFNFKKFTPDYCRAPLACSVFCLFPQHTENKQKTRAYIQHARSSDA